MITMILLEVVREEELWGAGGRVRAVVRRAASGYGCAVWCSY